MSKTFIAQNAVKNEKRRMVLFLTSTPGDYMWSIRPTIIVLQKHLNTSHASSFCFQLSTLFRILRLKRIEESPPFQNLFWFSVLLNNYSYVLWWFKLPIASIYTFWKLRSHTVSLFRKSSFLPVYATMACGCSYSTSTYLSVDHSALKYALKFVKKT